MNTMRTPAIIRTATILLAFSLPAATSGCVTTADFEKRNQAVNAKFAASEKKITANETALASLQKKLTAAAGEITALKARADKLAERLSTARESLVQHGEKLAGLRGDLGKAQANIKKNAKGLMEVPSQESFTKLSANVTALQAKDAGIDTQIATVSQATEATVKELQKVGMRVSKLDVKVTALASRTDRTVADRQALAGLLQHEYDAIQKRLAQLKNVLNTLAPPPSSSKDE